MVKLLVIYPLGKEIEWHCPDKADAEELAKELADEPGVETYIFDEDGQLV